MAEIARVSHTHEEIMNFMIANPTVPLGAVAEHFGYSQAWLSQLIHSHAFRARMRDKQDLAFGILAAGLSEKMEAVVHDALDIVHDNLLASRNGPQALGVADTLLHRLGYAPQRQAAAAPVYNNTLIVSQSDLAQARELIAQDPAMNFNGGSTFDQRSLESPVGGSELLPPAVHQES